MEDLAERLAAVPGVVAVTLGGSRAVGAAVEGSDWDFGLYYRGGLDPADISALGWPGRVFAPGEWGSIVNGGAWLTVGGAKVDLIYRDLDEVLRWTAAAGEGRFEIRREVGYVAGIATYILAGELALAGVETVVLEQLSARVEQVKGGAVQPRTAEILELRGLLEPLLARAVPRDKVGGHFAMLPVPLDATGWNTRHPYPIGVPQWVIEELLEQRASGPAWPGWSRPGAATRSGSRR